MDRAGCYSAFANWSRTSSRDGFPSWSERRLNDQLIHCNLSFTSTLQSYEQQLVIFGIDNSAELRFAFVASQAVALKATSIDYWTVGIPVPKRRFAIRTPDILRLIKRNLTATGRPLFF